MKPEQRLWLIFSRHYHRAAVLQRHEDRLSPDIPDVSFVDRSTGACGWVELKVLRSWGACSHLRPGQVNWLRDRAALGAPVWFVAAAPDGQLLWIPGARMLHRMREAGWGRDDWLAAAVPDPFSALLGTPPLFT